MGGSYHDRDRSRDRSKGRGKYDRDRSRGRDRSEDRDRSRGRGGRSGSRGRDKSGYRSKGDREWHEDWFCYTCKYVVFGSKPKCETCGLRREDGGEVWNKKGKDKGYGKGYGKGKYGGGKGGRDHGDWYCADCDFMIYGWKTECSKCGYRREDAERRGGDDKGYDKGYSSSWSKGSSKGGGKKGKKAGDWWCPTCDFNIYSWKTECNKCGMTKEEAKDREGSRGRDNSRKRQRSRSRQRSPSKSAGGRDSRRR